MKKRVRQRRAAEDVGRVVILAGPRKSHKQAGFGRRLVNHKTRSRWFQARKAWPVREAPIHSLVEERARAHASLAPAPGAAQWELIGPTNVGGRMTCAVCHPTKPHQIWAGAAGGGVWFSADAGRTWQAQWHSQDVLNVGALALDPKNPDIATVASFGHPHIFRSKDGGLTWEDVDKGQLPDVPHHSLAIPRDAPNTVYVCSDAGVFVSPDGGQTWTNITRNLPNVTVVDLIYHVHDGTLMAATYGRSLWRLRIR